MKLKYHFEKMIMDEQIMAVPCGSSEHEFQGVLKLNETAADILDLLAEDTTEEKAVSELMKTYEGSEAEIRDYVHEFFGMLDEEGILDREVKSDIN